MQHAVPPRTVWAGRSRLLAVALAAAFAAGSVLAQTSGSGTGTGAGTGTGTGTGAGTGTMGGSTPGTLSRPGSTSSQLQRADQGLLRDIAQANLAEIETGRIALDKSKDERVRKFAQQMVDDHTTAMKDVQQLAQTKGVTLPDGPDMKHKTVATALKALSGDTFDKQYMSQAGLGDHRKTHELLQKTQRDAKDADLKALATKMIPVVHGHLTEAEQIAPAKKR
jgi:putative membrane protein